MVQVVRAVLQNVHMALESHLHQLIPVTLTCMVAKNLGGSPAEDHWSLRDAAAALVGLVIARFGSEYPDIQMRISRQLLKAFLDPVRPLATHYGARLTSGAHVLSTHLRSGKMGSFDLPTSGWKEDCWTSPFAQITQVGCWDTSKHLLNCICQPC